ncbi:hypothetical protein GCM10007301_35560 [Azorhizobium oxalatiphilum]|uniref:Tetracyclin repressor-like C-terminal domain-containing protein n=1 Tax=Azorhizobium oxalatiphilum TaxID=980631 RepID=A0A917FE44_9HYPH|nr:TetR-like C-terminal domain-containing protein [Azorhizobium oxalatiphilum]GGF72621.1 hypothetical protein GCM10007301_35560 [Azorhizobium oxalatiphilum]
MSASFAASWRERFERAYVMLDRAVLRGELPATISREDLMQAPVAPAWFRSFVSHMPMDKEFARKTTADVLKLAR